MKIGIQQRFFLALLAATGLAVLGMFLIIHWSIDRGFLRFINMMETEWLERLGSRLTEEYAVTGSWDTVAARMPVFLVPWPAGPPGSHPPPPWGAPRPPGARPHDDARRPPDGAPGRPPETRWDDQPGHPPPPPRGQDFGARLVLQDAEQRVVFGNAPQGSAIHFIPLVHAGHKVGFLGLLPRKHLSESLQLHFISGQKTVLLLAAAVVLCLAVLFSLPLARGLLRPIRALAAGTRRLAAGEYHTRVEVDSTDELGRLARDFNDLAQALGKNETARRQYMADIAHELRTPLAILRGEIEAVEDGVRPAGPDTFRSLHAEVLQLSRLVDDLYQLALADAGMLSYRKGRVEPVALLQDIADGFQTRFKEQGLTFTTQLPAVTSASLYADPERLRQLLANLLTNSLKYTDRGGRSELRLTLMSAAAQITVEDSAPGVTEDELAALFDRSPARPASRRRPDAGSGLGLAICHNIVAAHGGTITAQASALGGLQVTVTLPLQDLP
ncbi:MAG: hypothetical protein BWK76_00070 [Desulfobulbaceae bacterium A2]|nr:MAG: hypothetical protein BWK76_00070 [Desulfobulbaceae bacterium A2]